MTVIRAQDLVRQFEGEPVFERVTFELRRGERVGLVGPNGSGKTTLLRILAGLDQPDCGKVLVPPGVTIGLLEQQAQFDPQRSLRAEAELAIEPLKRMHDELADTAAQLAQAPDQAQRPRLERRYDELASRLQQLGAFQLDHRVEAVLEGLGFSRKEFDRPVGSFSGGEQCRLMLAKLLLAAPDVLLMDEPSNHLDIDSTQWLERWLVALPQAMIIVNHDRCFLDTVTTRTWELAGGELRDYPGNYSAYRQQRDQELLVLERTWAKQQAALQHAEQFIRRYHAGQRATQAKDREKKLERLRAELVERPRRLDQRPAIKFEAAEPSGEVVIAAEGLSKRFEHTLFRDLSIQVQRGERVGLVGPNGSGKTMLLRILARFDQPDSGTVRHGQSVRAGYYDQHLRDLPAELTALEAVRAVADPATSDGHLRGLLARFGLRGEAAFWKVSELSGGQRSRVALARLAALRPNLLLLDEPTNHLDVLARESLQEAIQQFDGTVIVVSHDRYFLNNVVTRLIVLRPPEARVFEGNYAAYRDWLDSTVAAGDKLSDERSARQPQPDSRQQQRRRRQWKFPFRNVEQIEAEIKQREAELACCERKLADPRLYRDPDAVRTTRAEYEQLQKRLAELYEHWEEALERSG